MLKFKEQSLKFSKGTFNAIIKLSDTFQEILRWENNIMKVLKPIRYPKISIAIFTDDSLEGWGACMGNVSTEGAWFSRERIMHIDMLELKAIYKTIHKHINPFVPNAPFLYPLKTSENRNVFRRRGALGTNGLTSFRAIVPQYYALLRCQHHIQ